MSQCVVPSWNLRHQRQGIDQLDERNKSSHVDSDSNHHDHHQFQQPQSFSQFLPMSNYEVTELTWENGQLAMHELGGIFPAPPTTGGGGAGRAGDTLESIVHQATYCNKQPPPPQQQISPNLMVPGHKMEKVGSVVASSCGKWAEKTPGPPPEMVKKRTRSESEHCGGGDGDGGGGGGGGRITNNDHESACASANAAFSRENTNTNNNNDTTIMTWASFESPRSCTRTKYTTDDDSASHPPSETQEEERDTKGEIGRSYTTRKGRAAAVHNQSERRRRDRINQKMKALQKLVPNSSKTDKASMLDEVIEYLKQLQAQVQMMSNARLMPQIMMQQHLHQMSILARMGMGMGMGMGMIDTTSNPSHTMMHPTQVPQPFVVPQMIPPQTHLSKPDPTQPPASSTLQDQYSTLLAQSMNIDLYNRMAALQRQQQQTQAQQTSNNPMQSNINHVQGS